MSKHTTDHLIADALRRLDAAPDPTLSEAEQARADAMLGRILATPADVPVPVEPDRPRSRRRRRLRVAGGLAGATGVAVPALLLGGGGAYGSWTPEPEALTASAAARAGDTCRNALGVPDHGERVAIAERRGEWTYVLLAGPRGEATCLMPDELVATGVRHDGDDFAGSYSPDPTPPPALAPDGLDETESMESSTEEGWFVWAAGYVGSEVTGVTVHVSTGLDIEASVTGGRYAVWWPSVQPSSKHPSESWTYTIRLADGTTQSIRP